MSGRLEEQPLFFFWWPCYYIYIYNSCWGLQLIVCEPTVMLRRCFLALVSKQAVEGHHSRMRKAVWVALWSDIIFCVTCFHLLLHVAHSMFVTCFALSFRHCTDRHCTSGIQKTFSMAGRNKLTPHNIDDMLLWQTCEQVLVFLHIHLRKHQHHLHLMNVKSKICFPFSSVLLSTNSNYLVLWGLKLFIDSQVLMLLL